MTKIFTDLMSNAKTFDASEPRVGISRSIVRELEGARTLLGDPDYPSDMEDTDNEVQTIAQFAVNPVSPATFTLTFNLFGEDAFTTAAIPFDANAATITTAIDAASPASVGDGHIVVTGGPLDADDLILTFSGASVAGKQHGQTTITSTATAFPSPATVQTTPGVDAVSDEVQTINQFVNIPTGGTFTLTLNLQGEDPITTAPIAFDATAAAIETAIDVAVTAAAYAGWTNGDITVAAEATDLTDGDITLTFDGNSVDQLLHDLSTVSEAGLTLLDPLDDPAEATSAAGSTTRPALAVLLACGIIGGTLPEQGAAPASVVDAAGFRLGPNPHRLSNDTIDALCLQAAIEDSRDALYGELLAIIGIDV